MWSFKDNRIIAVESLLASILKAKTSIEGVTLLGGEPLDQYDETLALLKLCKEESLTTMLFTGYILEEIDSKNMGNILGALDILITGRYEEENRTLNHQWIGSTNQKIHFLTDTYKDFQKTDANYIEISIEQNGTVTMLGFPESINFLT
jgi:anaerobic ribonucleoside-triphosphate reductase activating protein